MLINPKQETIPRNHELPDIFRSASEWFLDGSLAKQIRKESVESHNNILLPSLGEILLGKTQTEIWKYKSSEMSIFGRLEMI